MKNLLICLILVFGFTVKSFSQFDWKNTGGPFGSRTSMLFSNDQYAFIPENDFLYRSDNGSNWEMVEHNVSNSMSVYYDTLVNILWDESLNMFLFQISYHNGENWLLKSAPDEITEYGDMVMCAHGIYIAQGFKGKIYKSTDLGDSWTSFSAPDSFEVMKIFEDRLYISGDSLLWRTDQHGEGWFDITPPLPHPFPFHTNANDFVAVDSHILVSSDETLFLSHDNGQTWDETYAYSAAIDDRLTIVGGAIYLNIFSKLLRTNDFGLHWDTLITDFYPRSISLTGLGNLLLMSTFDRGIVRWDESISEIVESNYGLTKSAIYDLALGADKIWAACGNGVFAYDIPTGIWSENLNLPLTQIEPSFISANKQGWVIYGEYYADQFYFSEDQGETWDTIRPGFEVREMQLLNENIFMLSSKMIRSLDKGQNWDTLDFNILSDVIIPFQEKNYIAGIGLLHYTNDDGLTWHSINAPITFLNLYSSGSKLFGIKSDDISKTDFYISEDAIHWDRADEGLPDIDIYTLWSHYFPLFFRDANNEYAFLGSEGHYNSNDGAMSWSPLATSQKGTDYLIHDNIIYLGNEGLYSSVIEDPFITGVNYQFESSLDLFSIIPNPAKDFITIQFENDITTNGIIRIYSIDGVLLKTIESDNLEGNINIPIAELSEGVYFAVFKGEKHVNVKSFVKTN